jgi:SpoVK/Ycf46/Vps4 family AAA+-type ATPase
LLYGPPGTGKTLLAAATAGSLDSTFFNVKASDMLSNGLEKARKKSLRFSGRTQIQPGSHFYG